MPDVKSQRDPMGGGKAILFLHIGAEMYGADKILLELVSGLPRERFVPVVILPEEGELSRRLERLKIVVYIRDLGILCVRHYSPLDKLRHIARIVIAFCSILRLSRKHNFALIHTNTSFIMAGALSAKVLRIPHVWHIHEIITQPKFWKVFSFIISRFSDVTVTVSRAVRDHLITGNRLNEGKTVVIHNGISPLPFEHADSRKVRVEFAIDLKVILIGMVARVNWWKGQDVFLLMAKELLETHSELKFMIVGSPHRGDTVSIVNLNEQIRRFRLEDDVILPGFRNDIPDVMAAMDIIVIPSTQPDPFPTVALEAMYSGKPVVSFSHGGVPEMVTDGMTCTLVPPVDVNCMIETVRTLIDDPDLRRKVGRIGKKRCEKSFTKGLFIRQFEDVYSKLLEPVGR